MILIKIADRYIKANRGVKSEPSTAEKNQLDNILVDNQGDIENFVSHVRTTIKGSVIEIAYRNSKGGYSKHIINNI